MEHQDWDPTTIHGKAAQHRAGASAVRRDPEAQRQAKLAAATDIAKPKVLSRESIANIQAYRRTNKLTQKQLDQLLSFPPNTINLMEAGHLTPTTAQLNSMNRLLKTGLTLS